MNQSSLSICKIKAARSQIREQKQWDSAQQLPGLLFRQSALVALFPNSLIRPFADMGNAPGAVVGQGFAKMKARAFPMADVSDRQHDIFDNPAKMTCRAGNLHALREAAFLLWEDGDRTRLRCDWCELMGATGWLTLDLLEREKVLAPGGFVGIDLDPARIDGCRQRRPDLKWVAGNLYELLDAAELANVGILNLDEYGEVGNRSTQVDFPLIRGLVKRGLDQESPAK